MFAGRDLRQTQRLMDKEAGREAPMGESWWCQAVRDSPMPHLRAVNASLVGCFCQ